jgi:hypothetical protein
MARKQWMKKLPFKILATGLALLIGVNVFALSRSIGRDIEFPKNYDPAKAAAIRKVVQDKRFKFIEGTVSYWPPDWGTRLSFEGDDASLTAFMAELRTLPGIGLRMILYRGRNDEGRRDSDWHLAFSHARPDQLTIYLNLNARNLELQKLQLPEWSPENK